MVWACYPVKYKKNISGRGFRGNSSVTVVYKLQGNKRLYQDVISTIEIFTIILLK